MKYRSNGSANNVKIIIAKIIIAKIIIAKIIIAND